MHIFLIVCGREPNPQTVAQSNIFGCTL